MEKSLERSPKSPALRLKSFEKVRVLGVFTASAALCLLLLFLSCFFYVGGVRSSSWGLGFVSEGEDREAVERGESCDLFEGNWVWDESYPLYDSRNCSLFLDEGFRCTENGRPDDSYAKWRWQPKHCNLPRFDAKKMLEKLRNRRLVFVGDSIGRNQWESLLCLLSLAVVDKSSIYEVNGSPITKHIGYLVYMFKDYNCTVEYYRSPFLVVQAHAPAGLPEKVKTTLRLDTFDWMATSYKWRDADVLVFNTGHWWNYQKTIRGGCYFQVGDEVKMEMSVESAFQRSIETLFDWFNKEVNTSRTQILFRTYAPVHFRDGDWKTGGSCHLERYPDLKGSAFSSRYPSPKTWSHFLNPFKNKTLLGAIKVEVLNITEMTAQRKDGHSSLYYLGSSTLSLLHRQDCSHWCLPGVPDIWNELLYALFLRRSFHQNTSAVDTS